MEDVDLNFINLSTSQVIEKYSENVRTLKSAAHRRYNMNALQFDNYVFHRYFEHRELSLNFCSNLIFIKTEIVRRVNGRERRILFWIFYLFLACLFISFKSETSTIFLHGIQALIYPVMKIWRKITLPVIRNFPGLTELYDESCLLLNPFFQVDNLNCDPCANVKNVLDLTNMEKSAEFIPFVFKTHQTYIQPQDVYEMYNNNRDIFQRDAYRVLSTNNEITNLDELFKDINYTSHIQSHNLWRCNRMQPARLIRQLFLKPERLPKSGVAMERYIMVDTPNAASYVLPDTECSNVYVQQALGSRFIILRPTPECRDKCRTLSVRLPQSFVLRYNWWYWKPISVPFSATKTVSISFVGSYC